jgi:hypothetical protein
MKIRAVKPFTPGDPLRLQFPDQFAGVAIVFECSDEERDQLLAKFVLETMPEDYLKAASRAEDQQLIGKTVEYVGPKDQFKGQRAVIQDTTTWDSDEVFRHYVKFSDIHYGWFSEEDLKVVVLVDEPELPDPNAWRIGNRVRYLEYPTATVRAVELDSGKLFLRVERGDIPAVDLWPADECRRVLS